MSSITFPRQKTPLVTTMPLTHSQAPPLSPSPPTTPTSSKEDTIGENHHTAAKIQSIHRTLVDHAHDLRPSPIINGILTDLVEICISPYSEIQAQAIMSLLSDKQIMDLRRLCGEAEGLLEAEWARRMIGMVREKAGKEPNPSSILQTFPYYTNYEDLARLEFSLLSAFMPPTSTSSPNTIAFLGSGPLPLTSFLLSTHFPPHTRILNIDRDEAAIAMSAQLAAGLGIAPYMEFIRQEVCGDERSTLVSSDAVEIRNPKSNMIPWGSINVLFLAALVGMTSAEKIPILADLSKVLQRGTCVVVRSAWGVRGVLYPILELDPAVLAEAGYDVLATLHPWDKVVNSVVVLRVR